MCVCWRIESRDKNGDRAQHRPPHRYASEAGDFYRQLVFIVSTLTLLTTGSCVSVSPVSMLVYQPTSAPGLCGGSGVGVVGVTGLPGVAHHLHSGQSDSFIKLKRPADRSSACPAKQVGHHQRWRGGHHQLPTTNNTGHSPPGSPWEITLWLSIRNSQVMIISC